MAAPAGRSGAVKPSLARLLFLAARIGATGFLHRSDGGDDGR